MHRFRALLVYLALISSVGYADTKGLPEPAKPPKEEAPPAPPKIEIKPTARDSEIAQRLEAILQATGWFINPKVQVKEGVVFLFGEAKKDELKKWAGDLAHSTRDVSAVVNKMEVVQPSIWDFEPTLKGLKQQWRDFVRILPSLAFALFVFILTWFFAKFCAFLARKSFGKRISSPLLKDVLARGIGFLVFLFGFYVIFRILGLTTIALTILGGTGALGIILGIAFRDITENLLASIFLSIHHPFRNGDLIEIEGIQGYVQRLTIRSTVLISLDGNHVQIPNATVYKNTLRNFVVNPNYRVDFVISIGYDDPIATAQEIALKVLSEHPAVLDDPEPWVLVEDLQNATVTMRVYFWINGIEHSWLKVKSSVMRKMKLAMQEGKITMPSQSAELSIKGEVPIHILKEEPKKAEPPIPQEPNPVATSAEGGLSSESEDIHEQAKQSRRPEKGEEDLLKGTKRDKNSNA